MSDSKPDSNVRVRFAPSPTGYLHIGGARTALFNYLFARQHGGKLVLRVEDTDRERSTPEAVEAILDGMRYLGLDWDEGPGAGGDCGPYFQSERLDRHKEYVSRLLEKGAAYRCFCSRERLAELRGQQEANKERYLYDRRCLALSADEVEAKLAAGEAATVRFRVPEGQTVIKDLVRGDVKVDHAEVEDLIIARADGTPVYNLAVVADDHDMGMTHVIRGEDHLTNTSKQVLLFQALDLPLPQYAHIPLILGKGKGKLSKRDGAVSVVEYEKEGYLPEAMINFLVRMGWSFDDKEEIFTKDFLIENFTLSKVSKSGAMYDAKKLSNLGAHYMRERPIDELIELAKPFLAASEHISEADLADGAEGLDRITRMVELAQPRIEKLSQLPEQIEFYFEDPTEADKKAKKALRKSKDSAGLVAEYAAALAKDFPDAWGPRDEAKLEEHGNAFVESKGLGLGNLAQPVRALVTGRAATPGLFEVLAVVGQEAVVRRLAKASEWIEAASAQ